MRARTLACLLSAGCLLCPWAGTGPALVAGAPADSLGQLSPEGFSPAGAIRHYGTDGRRGRDGTLIDYIDGGAIAYERHGFRELRHAEYRGQANPGISLTLDVFTFASAAAARAALSDEAICPPGASPMGDGSQGKRYRFAPDYFFYFVSGRRLVYLHLSDDRLAGVLDRFGREVRLALGKEAP